MSIQNGKFTARWYCDAGHSVTASIIGDCTLPPLELPRARGEVTGQTGGAARLEAVGKNLISGSIPYTLQIMTAGLLTPTSCLAILRSFSLDLLPAGWTNVNNLPADTVSPACYFELTATDGTSTGVSAMFTWRAIVNKLTPGLVNQHSTMTIEMSLISDGVPA